MEREKIKNNLLWIVDDAENQNNHIDCDVVYDAIREIKKRIEEMESGEVIELEKIEEDISYLITSLKYRQGKTKNIIDLMRRNIKLIT